MFTVLQIAVELERFALDCTELASQYDMHKKSGGTAGKATSQLPGVPIFTLDDQWKDMEQRLLATILEFPNTIKRAQLFVDIWGDIEPEELYQSSQLLTLMAGFHELAGVILLTT